MKKNHMNVFKKFYYSHIKGYEVEFARNYCITPCSCPFNGFKEDYFILSKRKTKVTKNKKGEKTTYKVKSELMKIVDKSGREILKEGLYVPVYANQYLFIVFNLSSDTACFYKYDGTLIRTCDCLSPQDIRITQIGSSFKGNCKIFISVNHYSREVLGDTLGFEMQYKLTTLKHEVLTASNVFNDKGEVLFNNVGALTTYNYFGEAKILSFTKDNKCYLVFEDDSVVKCDMIMHIAAYGKLPILIGYKEKTNAKHNNEEEEIFYNFVSMEGNINSDVKIRSISRSDTTSAYRIENNEYKYNYISGLDGKLLTDTWYYNATCFSYSRVFAKETHSAFYTMYDTNGKEIKLPDNVKIKRIKTNFGFIQKPGLCEGLAIVDVRIFGDTADNHSYYDKEVYMDIFGNMYDL